MYMRYTQLEKGGEVVLVYKVYKLMRRNVIQGVLCGIVLEGKVVWF